MTLVIRHNQCFCIQPSEGPFCRRRPRTGTDRATLTLQTSPHCTGCVTCIHQDALRAGQCHAGKMLLSSNMVTRSTSRWITIRWQPTAHLLNSTCPLRIPLHIAHNTHITMGNMTFSPSCVSSYKFVSNVIIMLTKTLRLVRLQRFWLKKKSPKTLAYLPKETWKSSEWCQISAPLQGWEVLTQQHGQSMTQCSAVWASNAQISGEIITLGKV